MENENGLTRRDRRAIAPLVDVYESGDEILVRADVPGARPDGITVRLEKDHLFVRARRDEAAADYERTFVVPPGIDAGKIEASMKAGVLTIRLPKSEASKPRTIAVRAS
jgi:HSP20 family protein